MMLKTKRKVERARKRQVKVEGVVTPDLLRKLFKTLSTLKVFRQCPFTFGQ
jgi:hypothetical protein